MIVVMRARQKMAKVCFDQDDDDDGWQNVVVVAVVVTNQCP